MSVPFSSGSTSLWKTMLKNPKTTGGGIVGVLIAVLVVAKAILEGTPLTSEEVMLALAVVGTGVGNLLGKDG